MVCEINLSKIYDLMAIFPLIFTVSVRYTLQFTVGSSNLVKFVSIQLRK